MSDDFKGFITSDDALAGIPETFFRQILPEIEDANLLKLCLYLLWKANTIGDYGISFSIADLMLDKVFTTGLVVDDRDISSLLAELLLMAENKKICVSYNNEGKSDPLFFINCEAGRSALANAARGTTSATITLDQIQPNIFRMYKENIGPLTPLIADALRQAEKEYPQDWIKDALQLAVKNNVRRWRYVESILDRWQKEGRNGTDRKRDKTDYRSYLDD